MGKFELSFFFFFFSQLTEGGIFEIDLRSRQRHS